MRVLFDLDSPPIDVGGDPQLRLSDDMAVAATVRVLVLALIEIDYQWLLDHPDAPCLYDSGVVYCEEGKVEQFADIGTVIDQGCGDCEDLVAWRIAELREFGEFAQPIIQISIGRDNTLYHVILRRADGSIEDPSRILGMS